MITLNLYIFDTICIHIHACKTAAILYFFDTNLDIKVCLNRFFSFTLHL